MGEPRISAFLAVGFWAASGLAVLTYTAIAFKETATETEGAIVTAADPLVAGAAVFATGQVGAPSKPLDRGKFKQYHIKPSELGFKK